MRAPLALLTIGHFINQKKPSKKNKKDPHQSTFTNFGSARLNLSMNGPMKFQNVLLNKPFAIWMKLSNAFSRLKKAAFRSSKRKVLRIHFIWKEQSKQTDGE